MARLIVHLREVREALASSQSQHQMLWERLARGEPVLDELLAARREFDRHVRDAQEAGERLQEMGCVLRDLDLGLVDFPALAGTTEVFLCWRLGEDAIRYWHGLTEGYAGRKPLAEWPAGSAH